MNTNNRQQQALHLRPVAFAITAALGSYFPHALQAQQVADNEVIEELIVTATRRSNTVQDIPINITAIRGDDIEERRLVGLNEISQLVPGLQVVDRGPRVSVTDLIARGLNTSGLGPGFSSNSVGVYLGEVPLLLDLKTHDLERVEVLIGPQGTLYGSGTLSGAVRFIPVKPRDDLEFSFRGTAMALDHSDGIGSDIGFTVNAPLGDSEFAIRASIDVLDDPGYIDYGYVVREGGVSNPDPDFSDPDDVAANLRSIEDANGEDTLSGRFALRWTPTANVDATLTYYYQDVEAEGRTIANVEAFGTGPYESAYRYQEPFDSKNELIALEIIADLGFAELTSATGRSLYTGLGQRDQTDLLLDFEYGYEFFPSFSSFTREDEEEEILTQEIRLVSNGTGPLSWIAGLFYSNSDSELFSREFTPGFDQFAVDNYGGIQLRPDALEYISIDYIDLTEQALFGELAYQFADDWEITLGARLYEFEVDALGGYGLPLYDTLYLGAPPDEVFVDLAANDTDDSGSLFKVNLARNFSDDVLGYLTISEGYRIGGLNAVPECTPDQIISGSQELCALPDEILIKPDTTTNYEIGVHSTLADNRVTINAALFYVDWKDIQIDSTTIFGSLPITSNGGEARSKGVEFGADWRIGDSWQLSGNFSYTDAELTETTSDLLGDSLTGPLETPAGSRLPGSPEVQGALSLLYTTALSNGWSFDVRYGVTYMGDIANSLGAEQFASVEPWGGEIIPSYTLHSLTIGVAADRWSAAVFVDNLTDEYALTGTRTSRRLLAENRGLINDLPLRTYGYYIGRPRTAGLRFTYDF